MSMVNGAVFLVAVMALGCLVAIPWAMALDRRDRSAGKTVPTFEHALYILRRRFQVLGLTLAAAFAPAVERINAWLSPRTPSPYHLLHGPKSGCLECEDK